MWFFIWSSWGFKIDVQDIFPEKSLFWEFWKISRKASSTECFFFQNIDLQAYNFSQIYQESLWICQIYPKFPKLHQKTIFQSNHELHMAAIFRRSRLDRLQGYLYEELPLKITLIWSRKIKTKWLIVIVIVCGFTLFWRQLKNSTHHPLKWADRIILSFDQNYKGPRTSTQSS